MDSSIITALITGGVTLIGTILANYSMRKKDAIANAVRDQKIEDSITELSKRVDAHNGLVDEVKNMGKTLVRMETKIESLESMHKK